MIPDLLRLMVALITRFYSIVVLRLIRALLILFVFGCSSSISPNISGINHSSLSRLTAPNQEAKVYFGNGINTTLPQALRNLKNVEILINKVSFPEVKNRITNSLGSEIEYDLAFIQTSGLFDDVYKSIALKLIKAGNPPEIAWGYADAVIRDSVGWIYNIAPSLLPSYSKDIVISISAETDPSTPPR
ncbi:MAG: hypothetical protein OHK0012_11240 [Synechococcales cyanobacterium]